MKKQRSITRQDTTAGLKVYKLSNFLTRHKIVILFLMFVLSLSIRIGFAFYKYSHEGTQKWGDALLYLADGQSFASGDFYPVNGDKYDYMVAPPLIPALVALSQIIFGDSIKPMLLLNCLLGALLVFVLYYLGASLLGIVSGYILSLWSVFNFSFINVNHSILKEPLIIFLVPLITLCMINLWKKKDLLLNTISSSILFSILIHTDERFFIYAPILLVLIVLTLSERSKLTYALVWLAVLIVTMVPWTIRNYRQFGELVILTPRTTAFTSKLWGTDFGNMRFASKDLIEKMNEGRKDKAVEIGEQFGIVPREYGKYEKYLKSFVHYWKPAYFKLTYIQYGFRPQKWSVVHNMVGIIFYGIFLPFYITGFILALLKRNLVMTTLALVPFIHSLMHTVLIWPLERYRLPMNFLIVLMGVWFVREMYVYFQYRRSSLIINKA